MKAEFAPLFELGVAERIQLVEDLWDSIAEEEISLPLTAEQCAELRRRKERFLASPDSGCTWEQAKQQARAPHG